MFHNYFFLKRLSDSLNQNLTGLQVLDCYSQNKDELIVVFGSARQEIILRASLQAALCLIDFPEEVHKAKKNVAELYQEILDKKVLQVCPFSYERSFQIILENNYSLIFKMHSSRSNVLLVHHDKVTELFKSQLAADQNLKINDLSRDWEADFSSFEKSSGDPRQFLPALGKEVLEFLKNENYFDLNLPKKWAKMKETLRQLETNPIRIYTNGKPELSLLNTNKKILLETDQPILAANELRKAVGHYHYTEYGKNKELKLIDEKIQKTKNYLHKTSGKKEEITTRRNYGEIANLIMANLHNISMGKTRVSLNDFYTGDQIEIKLKPGLSPQKNAEDYYRKAKNQQIEINQLNLNIDKKRQELNNLKLTRQALLEAEDPKALRKIVGKPQKETEKALPYHEYSFDGYDILIGKNAKSNDELTLKKAKKDDLWLHAKDVSGSHVIIKHQSGKTIPKNVLERAAEIAAWYSKRKNDSLCPVIYTPKKFVRKRKGDPPGAMVVEKEEVIMVEPHPFK